MSKGPDYEFIRNIPVFKSLPEETVSRLVNRMDKKRIRAGEYFFQQADPVNYLYVLEMGKVEIYKGDAEGRKLTLWYIEPGNVFCLANMFAGCSFASAEAQADCLAFRISRDSLLASIAEDQQLSLQFIHCLSSKMATYSTMLEDFTFRDVKSRLARLLLRFSKHNGKRPVCDLTHGELASLLGTCREMISRTLKSFRQQGLLKAVSVGRKQQLHLLDIERLRQVSRQEAF